MNSIINKAVLGELTLGEVWSLLKERVHSVFLLDSDGDKWGPYGTIHFRPGVGLGFSSGDLSEDEAGQVELFDVDTKVKVCGDHIKFVHFDNFGDEEEISVYFLFQPEPEVIKLDFLLPGGGG